MNLKELLDSLTENDNFKTAVLIAIKQLYHVYSSNTEEETKTVIRVLSFVYNVKDFKNGRNAKKEILKTILSDFQQRKTEEAAKQRLVAKCRLCSSSPADEYKIPDNLNTHTTDSVPAIEYNSTPRLCPNCITDLLRRHGAIPTIDYEIGLAILLEIRSKTDEMFYKKNGYHINK